jgi:hypothetical protein
VRTALTPLAQLAGRTGCAVLVVRHLVKRWLERAMLRGQGSMGIVAAARSALLVGPHPADPGRRVLSVAKSNMGPRAPSLGYRVVAPPGGVPTVEWTGVAEVTADELGRRREEPMRASERAIDWLRRELAAGPRRAADVYAAAAVARIPERTLNRAKEWLRARSHRVYDHKAGRGEWYWFDPDAAWPKGAPFPKPEELWLPDLPGM